MSGDVPSLWRRGIGLGGNKTIATTTKTAIVSKESSEGFSFWHKTKHYAIIKLIAGK